MQVGDKVTGITSIGEVDTSILVLSKTLVDKQEEEENDNQVGK